jgi:hypothetical protein
MVCVILLNWKAGVSGEQMDHALARRAAWQYPQGTKVLGEYWLPGASPAVVSIVDVSSYEPLLEIGLTWGDVFDIAVSPATTAEEGLKLGPQILHRRHR